VLRFDRRGDVSLRTQAADARSAIAELRGATSADLPVAVWGFSQGAWVAMLLAHQTPLAGIAVVGASGVSPAEQMRYTSARHVREAGFDEGAVADMLQTRQLWEDSVRGRDIEAAQAALERASRQPWFPFAWLPATAEPPTPDDFEFDFDPAPLIRTLPCPLLAVVGDDDRWVPLPESIAVLQTAPNVEILHVPQGGHAPTEDGDGEGPILPGYEHALVNWLKRQMPRT
jgi:pimeloyl-ACP methyl ester carboxylesterase